MSLEAAAQMAKNPRFRERVEAGCRQIGHAKIGQPGAAGKLAEAATTDPTTIVHPFITELAADSTVTDLACPDCGYGRATDDQIRYVIEMHWDQIAAKFFPDLGIG